MLKREIRSLNNKLRNVRDKRQMVMQERQLLQERIETLVGSIGNEVESRRGLRKEINEMNEAFKEEIMDMAREQKAANELEDCYYSDDEELVVNTHKRDDLDDDLDWEAAGDGMEVDDTEDSVEDILKVCPPCRYRTILTIKVTDTFQGCRKRRAGPGAWRMPPPHILADQLTISQPDGQIMPPRFSDLPTSLNRGFNSYLLKSMVSLK